MAGEKAEAQGSCVPRPRSRKEQLSQHPTRRGSFKTPPPTPLPPMLEGLSYPGAPRPFSSPCLGQDLPSPWRRDHPSTFPAGDPFSILFSSHHCQRLPWGAVNTDAILPNVLCAHLPRAALLFLCTSKISSGFIIQQI